MTIHNLLIEIDDVTDEEALKILEKIGTILNDIREDREADAKTKNRPITESVPNPTMTFAFGDDKDIGSVEPTKEESTFSRYMKSAVN